MTPRINPPYPGADLRACLETALSNQTMSEHAAHCEGYSTEYDASVQIVLPFKYACIQTDDAGIKAVWGRNEPWNPWNYAGYEELVNPVPIETTTVIIPPTVIEEICPPSFEDTCAFKAEEVDTELMDLQESREILCDVIAGEDFPGKEEIERAISGIDKIEKWLQIAFEKLSAVGGAANG